MIGQIEIENGAWYSFKTIVKDKKLIYYSIENIGKGEMKVSS